MLTIRHAAAGLFSIFVFVATPSHGAPRTAASARLAAVLDKSDIVELSARFDNALDAEDQGKFVSAFVNDGVLEGFWGQSRGTVELGKAFQFMVSTFSKHKRHVVTNHEINIDGDKASMFCYLTVFDRDSLAVTGTAIFRDELVRTAAGWRFKHRTLAADPNVDAIIEKLKNQQQ